ncbi:MAG: type VI secretion system ATPase TssH, partial [Deltaproteobacteria bacterium]|nr:type VI secretion system ATPase TssH [Deltaproteobacteria bacterium]
MRMDKLTVKAQESLQEGQALARRASHPGFEPEHLARALLQQQDGIATPMLQKLGADPKLVLSRLDEGLSRLPRVEGGEPGQAGPRLVKVL